MVTLSNLHKSFGSVHAVRGVSFDLPAGQVAGLLGHNGAGKTTTIRMIAGYFTPDVGAVTVASHDLVRDRARALQMLGYLPESAPMYPEMNVQDYLDFRGRLYGMKRNDRRSNIDRVIDRCWLRDVRTRRITALSKGYKQRVGLASALLHNPPVLILDEPTNGLDPTQIHETRGLIRELADKRTVLISSHILPEIERLCDRIIIFAGGRVRADGAIADLTQRSRGPRAYAMQFRAGAVGTSPGTDIQLHDLRVQMFLDAVKSLPGVKSISEQPSEAGWSRRVILAEELRPPTTGSPLTSPTIDLGESIAQAALRYGIALRELTTQTTSLEQVFMQVTEEAAREGGTA
jgi:ABC-2 type transport system ATP-binding protein